MNEFSVTEYYKEALFNLESNLKNEGNAHNRARYAAEIDVVKRTLEALRMDAKEAIIVMKIRHRFRDADYEKPYCSACNHYVPDANASFCCWCGAKFVTACAFMSADEAEVEK